MSSRTSTPESPPTGTAGWGRGDTASGGNYSVLQDETRAELYIDDPVATDNKALFDFLHAQRAAVEAEFGGPLAWQRLDDKRACRISFSGSRGVGRRAYVACRDRTGRRRHAAPLWCARATGRRS